MKKIISLLIITALSLSLLTSCAGKVSVESGSAVTVIYDYEGTSVTSDITGTNGNFVINTLNGTKITKDAPTEAKYDDGVYLKVGEDKFYIDLNGSTVLKVGNRGYAELEQYRFDAVTSLFSQFGINFGE